MILGIGTAVVYVLCAGVFFTARIRKNSRAKRFFYAAHKPLGNMLLLLALVHLAFAVRLFRQRPVWIFITGIGMLLCAAAAKATGAAKKNRKAAVLLHRLSACIMAALLTAHIAFCVTGLQEYKSEIAAVSVGTVALSEVADGTYEGDCDVGYIYAKVRVRVAGGRIETIDLLEHRNERGAAGEGVIGRILEEQRADVDAVSGATNSSRAIEKAVENALESGIPGWPEKTN